MEKNNVMKKVLAVLLFTALVLIGSQINFSPILGAENQSFTFFQFFGAIPGLLLGPLFGAIAVFGAELIKFVVFGTELSWVSVFRLFPMVLAALYFGSKKMNLTAFISVACMALFIMHPVGQQAWIYSLYWLIPLIAMIFTKNLFFKSLGATFTAHAIGSTIWIYSFPSTPEFWLLLIPVVAVERLLFASGISVSYIVFNTVLSKIEHILPIEIDSKYVFSKKMIGL
ncbi:MAG: hypothetical protein JW703_03305 [Candidatus Diapherotrites archaeon]|nr:hypothetical protein [Candidatus Diapherotrites archaeon]